MSDAFDQLLGQSAEFSTMLRAARLVAMTDATALILGESGTGKELLAHAIHQHSSRIEKPFVTINCAALPEHTIESELFGHAKGAFTGAITEHQGRVQAADNGTLFLDEIGELPLTVQAKLLRFLESGECQAVGKTQVYHVNVRVVAATHRDLRSYVKEGKFREDLYYRLNIIPLELPPLRKRKDDIELLLNKLTAAQAERHQLIAPRYDKKALKQLKNYPWPGNIRELRNFCERMLILHSDQLLTLIDLPDEIQEPKSSGKGFTLPESGINLFHLEKDMIDQALDRTEGNRSQAAKLLGLTRDTLLYRMKKYMIGSDK